MGIRGTKTQIEKQKERQKVRDRKKTETLIK